MNDADDDSRRRRTATPWFVASCAAGFLIISGCVVYFLAKFFL